MNPATPVINSRMANFSLRTPRHSATAATLLPSIRIADALRVGPPPGIGGYSHSTLVEPRVNITVIVTADPDNPRLPTRTPALKGRVDPRSRPLKRDLLGQRLWGRAAIPCRRASPEKSVTINLASANVREEGAGFDLPIAVGF
jgi:hypothetical protein